MSKTLIVIIGPTAIGKTSMAIELAQHFKTEIISSDSRQFYKEMSIGTAVPSPQELESIPHHFIQHKSITQDYTVGNFEREAIAFISDYFQHHSSLVMVGGSGLYEKAVTQGLDQFPNVPKSYREDLIQELEKTGLKPLQQELEQKDPAYSLEVDKQNAHRVIRALEVIRFSGNTFSSYRSKNNKPRDFNVIKIGLNTEREIIYQRINRRVDEMMANGLLAEVENLYPHRNLNALQTVGYRELFAYLEGSLSLEEAIAEIKKNTRRYAKRQLTWYRKDNAVKWFRPDQVNDIMLYLDGKLGLN